MCPNFVPLNSSSSFSAQRFLQRVGAFLRQSHLQRRRREEGDWDRRTDRGTPFLATCVWNCLHKLAPAERPSVRPAERRASAGLRSIEGAGVESNAALCCSVQHPPNYRRFLHSDPLSLPRLHLRRVRAHITSGRGIEERLKLLSESDSKKGRGSNNPEILQTSYVRISEGCAKARANRRWTDGDGKTREKRREALL